MVENKYEYLEVSIKILQRKYEVLVKTDCRVAGLLAKTYHRLKSTNNSCICGEVDMSSEKLVLSGIRQ